MNTLSVLQANNIDVAEYWSEFLLGMIKKEKEEFVFTMLGEKKSLPKRSGTKTLAMRRYNHLPVSNHELTEGVPPTSLKVEAQRVDVTLKQYGAFIEETDVADDIGFDDIKSIYIPELARHAAEVAEKDIVASFSEGSDYYVGTSITTVDDYTNANAATSVLTLNDLRVNWVTMKSARRKGNKKAGGKPIIVAHPSVMQDLLDDANLENKLLVPGNDNQPIKAGNLENYVAYGMSFKESLSIEPTANANSVNVYRTIMLGHSPYAVTTLNGTHVKFYETGYTASKSDPLGQKRTFGYKFWQGSKVIDPNAIINIYSTSKFDAGIGFDVNGDIDTVNGVADEIGQPANQA